MKYWGRAIILYFTITALLYGTREVWTTRSYNVSIGDPIATDARSRAMVVSGGGGTPGNR